MIDATNYDSILNFAVEISRRRDYSPRLCAAIYLYGLMKVDNFLIEWALQRLEKKRGTTELYWSYSSKIRTGFIDALIGHMLHGKDLEDEHSVGGFSQRELNILENIVRSNI